MVFGREAIRAFFSIFGTPATVKDFPSSSWREIFPVPKTNRPGASYLLLTMKFSSLVIASVLAVPAAAEIYLKEQFNDEVGAARGSYYT
jgi:hypothetical protein